jgi:hypothetical protein
MFACPAVPPAPPPAVDRPRYELDVRVHSDLSHVTGRLKVRFTPNRPTRRLVFRLWPNGPLQQLEGMHLDVGKVTSGGKTLHTVEPDPTTRVVPVDLRAGESITVELPWRLDVPSAPRDRIGRFPGGLRLGSFFPVLAWDARRGWAGPPDRRDVDDAGGGLRRSRPRTARAPRTRVRCPARAGPLAGAQRS